MVTDGAPIGFLGLDELGEAIARRLSARGRALVVWDMRPERRKAVARGGANGLTLAPSLADLGRDCELIISVLPIGELRAAALGDADRTGFALEMQPGSLIVDMGVADPREARQLAIWLGRGGIGLIDAPALGSAADSREGTLTLPVGGYFEFVDRLTPLLSLLGTVTCAGGPGAGHALAAAMAYARAASVAAAREALRVGESLGLAPELMGDVAAAAAGAGEPDPRVAIAEALAADRDMPLSTRRKAG